MRMFICSFCTGFAMFLLLLVSPVLAIDINMVHIPGGTFIMGSDGYGTDEKPIHRVTVSSFDMGVTEVTQAQWQYVMGNNPSGFKGDNLPVENVSWDEALEFCRKLSQMTGQRYDLPTEAEWEYACRAGTNTFYYTGDREGDLWRVGWYNGNSGSSTHPVGQKEANAFGLYDMHGNVLEWCKDWYGKYGKENVNNPQGPPTGHSRVARGGCWYLDANRSRSTRREDLPPDFLNDYLGFRVVRR